MTGVSGQSRWSPCWRDDGPVYGICGLHAMRSVYDATMTGGLCGGYAMGMAWAPVCRGCIMALFGQCCRPGTGDDAGRMGIPRARRIHCARCVIWREKTIRERTKREGSFHELPLLR